MVTPFHDIQTYLSLPRTTGLRLSPDGSRLITTVATLNAKRNQYRSALWHVDPTGAEPARTMDHTLAEVVYDFVI